MDRLFVLQKSYLEDKYNIDGVVIKKLLDLYCYRNLDRYVISDTYEEKQGFDTVLVGDLVFTGANKTKPIEVPKVLRQDKYLNREYDILLGKDINSTIGKFVKDADKLKSWNNLLYLSMNYEMKDKLEDKKHYVVSEIIHIQSEYRVFVFLDEIQSIQCYSSLHLVFPDLNKIYKMIHNYKQDKNRPQAYTLDICVDIDGNTSLLEVHDFVACGLYGFQDPVLLDMLSAGYRWYTNKK